MSLDPVQERETAAQAMRRIDDAWQHGRLEDLGAMLHENVVMVMPDFRGRVEGRAAMLSGFADFTQHAEVRSLTETEQQTDCWGSAAMCSKRFDMEYVRGGKVYRSRGRDLWMFQKHEGTWLAVWRTMLDVTDEPLGPA